ncbi:MAG: hypothetical protein FWF53_03050, partial [Candidatus Azobacteroides sp.]|nr:hypothetical protein [Candidatus Azobacteroides sp.]
MKRVYFIILLQALIASACAQLKNDTAMVEHFNYKAVEGLSYPSVLLQEGDWLIGISYAKDTKNGFQDEYAPARDFYIITKIFHPNGVIKYRCKF